MPLCGCVRVESGVMYMDMCCGEKKITRRNVRKLGGRKKDEKMSN